MARNNGKKEKQHYVPQFILRNFSFNKKGKKKRDEQQIYVFDKKTDKSFIANVGDIATEKAFYDFYIGEEIRSLEPTLSRLEKTASDAIAKIISNESLDCLNEQEKVWLSLFVTVQYLRVKHQRVVIKDMMEQMEAKLVKMGFNPNDVDGFQKLSDEEIKQLSIQSFSKDLMEYAGYIGNKNILLFKHPEGSSLYVSDNPVTLHNDNKFGFYGNIGLAVKGIQIYFPISKNMALAFWCTSIQEMFEGAMLDAERNIEKIKAIGLLSVNINREQYEQQLKELIELHETLKERQKAAVEGSAYMCSKENVIFMNSLQVRWSHRYVYSHDNDFSLVRQMIADNENYREGVKMSVG